MRSEVRWGFFYDSVIIDVVRGDRTFLNCSSLILQSEAVSYSSFSYHRSGVRLASNHGEHFNAVSLHIVLMRTNVIHL